MPRNVDKGNGGPVPGKNENLIFEADGVAGRYQGGRGDNFYFVDHVEDVVIEKNNAGTDSVIASVNWTLSENVENLSFEGEGDFTGSGNDADNQITGSIGNDTLSGGRGDDIIFGGEGDDYLDGGEGSDFLDGGLGLDTASFLGAFADYSMELDGDTLVVTSLLTGSQDTLRDIEWLVFDDVLVSVASLATESIPTFETAADSVEVLEDGIVTIDVLGNDAGETLTVVDVSQGQSGSVAINGDGTLAYAPDSDIVGADNFTYTVMDENGATLTESVTVDILPVNDSPVAVDDSFAIEVGAEFSGTLNVLANDTDPDGDVVQVKAIGSSHETLVAMNDNASSQMISTDAGGDVEIQTNGSFLYTAPAGYSGDDNFVYTITDGQGASSTATVTLFITGDTVMVTPVEPEPTPYYVDDMIYGDPYRLNAGAELGTPVTVTFAFLTEIPDYYGTSDDWADFSMFTEEQQQATRALLAEIESFSNIVFIESDPSDATMTFGMRDLGGADGMAYLPTGTSTNSVASDIWIDAEHAMMGFDPGGLAYDTLMHEVGHSLGLKHPTLPTGEDTKQYSVMEAYAHPDFGLPDSYQLYDVAALQYLYGATTTATAVDDVYTYSGLADETHVIWDAGGVDTLDLSAAEFGVHLDLNEGAFSDVTSLGSDNIAIAFDTVIENAIGGYYDDTILGNEVDNRIEGGAGNDTLAGGDGIDTFVFGSGWGQDTIEDYSVGEDLLDFSGTGLMLEELSITTGEGNTYLSDGENILTLVGLDRFENDFDGAFLLI